MEKTKKAFLVAPKDPHDLPQTRAPGSHSLSQTRAPGSTGEPAVAGLTVQLPPFLQGPALHSSTSVSQLAPVYPGRQEHV